MAELEEKLNAILGDQEAMGRIMALARSLSTGEGAPPTSPEEEPGPRSDSGEEGAGDPLAAMRELDPRLLQMGMKILREYQRSDDKNTALLLALRPFLRRERYARLDRAVQLARLARVIRVAFASVGGTEGEDHV